MKTCPYCWEDIQNTVKKCRYCWERLDRNTNKMHKAQKWTKDKAETNSSYNGIAWRRWRIQAYIVDDILYFTLLWWIINLFLVILRGTTIGYSLAWIKFIWINDKSPKKKQLFFRFLLYGPVCLTITYLFFIIPLLSWYSWGQTLTDNPFGLIWNLLWSCLFIFNLIEIFWSTPTFYEKRIWIKKIQYKNPKTFILFIIIFFPIRLPFLAWIMLNIFRFNTNDNTTLNKDKNQDCRDLFEVYLSKWELNLIHWFDNKAIYPLINYSPILNWCIAKYNEFIETENNCISREQIINFSKKWMPKITYIKRNDCNHSETEYYYSNDLTEIWEPIDYDKYELHAMNHYLYLRDWKNNRAAIDILKEISK